jgi:hypothetical protein
MGSSTWNIGMNITDILNNNWHMNEKCTEPAIEEFNKSAGILPDNDYLDFLKWSNGGEGYIGNNYISLWKIENIVQLNKDYMIQKYLGDRCIAFGTDGGDNCYCFDYSENPCVIRVPLGDLDPAEKKIIADTFSGFIKAALEIDFER